MIEAKKVWAWRQESMDAHAKARREMDLDYRFYDNEQWSEEERRELEERGQPPLVLNFIKPTIDFLIGTETRVRTDVKAIPRAFNDPGLAEVLNSAMRFELDNNDGEFKFRKAFECMVKGGVGWIVVEENPRKMNGDILISNVPWREIRYDPMSKEYDLSDARFVMREKWCDVEDCIARWPQFTKIFTGEKGRRRVEFDEERPQPYESLGPEHDPAGNVSQWADDIVDPSDWWSPDRQRVLIIEVQYRVPKTALVLRNKVTGEVERFYEDDKLQLMSVYRGLVTVERAVVDEIHECLVVGNKVLFDRPTKARHGMFKWVPFRAYQADKDGSDYGLIRQMRDPQSDLNKRAAKALHILNTAQILAEKGAFDDGSEEEIAFEAARPDGFIKVAKDALKENRFQIFRDNSLAQQQIAIANERRIQIQEVAGVNQEAVGQETNASSGKAILARQAQGNTIIAPLFDNYRRSKRIVSYILASEIQRLYAGPRFIRITDDAGSVKHIPVNVPYVDQSGNARYVYNDISRLKYDIVMGEEPYHESVRQAMAEQFAQLMQQLPPNVSVYLLDIYFGFLDFPQKDKVMQRIQQLMAQQDQANAQAQQQAEMQRTLAANQAIEDQKDRELSRITQIANLFKSAGRSDNSAEKNAPQR